ncbi:MAG: type II secretion system protein J [Pseudobdellovibrionaceae bacterium]
MKKHPRASFPLGFSVAEISVALAVGSLVALGGAYVLTTSTQTQVTISAQNELNNEHLLALQKVRNKQEILSRLGLNTPQAQACFGRSGTATCEAFSVPSPMSTNQQINSYFAAGSATFVNTVTYRVNCSAQRCTHLEFNLQTELDPTYSAQRKMVASRRVSQVNVPGSILFSRAEYDFSCLNGTNKLLERIDHETLRATCKAIQVPMDCTLPLAGFGSATAACQTMENQTCGGMGFSSLGVFASQSSCNPGGTSAAAPPPAPIPTTTVPPATTTTVPCPVGTGLAGLGGPHGSRPECKCATAGTVWDTGSSTCATPSTCAPNYSATSLGPAGFSIVGAVPPLTCFCPASYTNTGIGASHSTYGGCKCPMADHFINASGSCATCPTSAKPITSSPAPLGQSLPAPNNECKCPGADEYYSSGLGCSSCATVYPGSVLVGTGGAGATVSASGGNCACKNATEIWNASTSRCEVPAPPPSGRTIACYFHAYLCASPNRPWDCDHHGIQGYYPGPTLPSGVMSCPANRVPCPLVGNEVEPIWTDDPRAAECPGATTTTPPPSACINDGQPADLSRNFGGCCNGQYFMQGNAGPGDGMGGGNAGGFSFYYICGPSNILPPGFVPPNITAANSCCGGNSNPNPFVADSEDCTSAVLGPLGCDYGGYFKGVCPQNADGTCGPWK